MTHTFICIFHNIYDKVHLGYFKEQLSLLVISSGIALIVLSLKLRKENNHVGTTQAVQYDKHNNNVNFLKPFFTCVKKKRTMCLENV